MLLIGGGRVITRDETNPFLENGAVLIDGTKIVKVGDTGALKAEYKDAEYIDAKGGVIMPGLINAHHHIYSALARGLSIPGHNPANFLDILDGLWWTLDRKLTLEQTRLSAAATYLDCVKNGVTTIFDHHASFGSVEGSLQTIADEAERFGVRSCLCYEVSDRDGAEKSAASVKENLDFIKYAAGKDGDMLKGMVGLHASFTVSDATLASIAKDKPDAVGYHVHVAEGLDDRTDSLEKYGKPVVARLHDCGVLGEKTIAVHCIHIDESEMELLKETDTMVVHNPESNMGNAVGCPPILEIVGKGILTGLGTDGYTSDMLESYKVANILHKHSNRNPNCAWGEIPQMLFDGNRNIAGRYFETPVGVLAEGAAADVIVLDYIPLTPMTADNCNSHILFGMTGRSVVTTVANGKILMLDRDVKVADEEKVLAEAREQAVKLWDSIIG